MSLLVARRGRTGAFLALFLAGLLVAVPGPSAAWTQDGAGGAAESEPSWRPLLRRAADAARRQEHSGDTLWVVWTDQGPHVTLSAVRWDGGQFVVSMADRYTVRLGASGGSLVDHEQGWRATLGAVESRRTALERKYEVAAADDERLLGRPCTRLEIRRRADGSLRERLCIDKATGLLVRRESFEGADRRVRLFTYLALDVGPRVPRSVRPSRSGDRSVRRRATSAMPVGPAALEALRAAGWVIPESLPGGYEPVGVYAVDGVDGQPLQIVYDDGLYTVSLFQQRGRPDWESLPDGARRSEDMAQPAFEWPGALPRRLVWEAGGTTFSLVGDAPPGEFVTIADSLPRPAVPGPAARVRRGLGRLWRWVSPWGEG